MSGRDLKMSKFNPPTALSLDGNVAENWNKFKKEFKFFMTATESNDKPEDVKTSRLLSCIGEKARDIYYTFQFENDDDSVTLEPVMAKFDEYLSPKKNITYLRFRFFSYNQADGQTTD